MNIFGVNNSLKNLGHAMFSLELELRLKPPFLSPNKVTVWPGAIRQWEMSLGRIIIIGSDSLFPLAEKKDFFFVLKLTEKFIGG